MRSGVSVLARKIELVKNIDGQNSTAGLAGLVILILSTKVITKHSSLDHPNKNVSIFKFDCSYFLDFSYFVLFLPKMQK